MELLHKELTEQIIGAALKVHIALGPGLLEGAYETCLTHELRKAGLKVDTQVVLPVTYDGVNVDLGYRIDLLVSDRVVVELKALDQLLPVHVAQLLTYLKLSRYPVGLLMNFNVVVLQDGIKRKVL